MNAAAAKIAETLKNHTYFTGKELLSIFALRDIGLCDQDVCCRIRFPKRTKLGTLYFLEANEKGVLSAYITDKWGTLKAMALDGEFSRADFPRRFRSILRDHLDREMAYLEGEIGSLQDEIASAEATIEEYDMVLTALK